MIKLPGQQTSLAPAVARKLAESSEAPTVEDALPPLIDALERLIASGHGSRSHVDRLVEAWKISGRSIF